MSEIRRVRIAGTGAFLPERRLTNSMLEARDIGTSNDWIVERTGILERRMVEPGTPVSEIALPAAKQAIAAAGITPQDVDAIVFATSTPDSICPPSGCMLQKLLDASSAMAFDVISGCCGFVVALDLGRSMLASGQYNNVLVVGADIMTSMVNPLQRDVCIIFGDGAGAAVLQTAKDEQGAILRSVIRSQGDNEVMYVKAGGSRHPTTAETVANDEQFFQMEGRRVYKFAVKTIESLVHEVLKESEYELSDIDWFVPHQMNKLILKSAFVDRLGVPWERVVVNLERYGNTTAGTVPIALDEAVRDGRIQRGDLICMVVVGAGLTWGATLARF